MADDMMEAEMENSESSLAIEIMAGRKSDNTKNQCKHKVEHFKKWLQSRHPVCIEESGSTDLSAVDRKILKEFLGHICKKKDDEGVYCDPVVFLSYQHVSGYKSAILRTALLLRRSKSLMRLKECSRNFSRVTRELSRNSSKMESCLFWKGSVVLDPPSASPGYCCGRGFSRRGRRRIQGYRSNLCHSRGTNI